MSFFSHCEFKIKPFFFKKKVSYPCIKKLILWSVFFRKAPRYPPTPPKPITKIFIYFKIFIAFEIKSQASLRFSIEVA